MRRSRCHHYRTVALSRLNTKGPGNIRASMVDNSLLAARLSHSLPLCNPFCAHSCAWLHGFPVPVVEVLRIQGFQRECPGAIRN